MLFSNNDTIVTVSEFFHNPAKLIKGTIERKANLIVLDNNDQNSIKVNLPHTLLRKWVGEIVEEFK